jgi:prepilin-type N-terminal cleavage/methylation domain-containing protein/prepilin-type processing-associated H-X9-DG protein
MCRHRGFTLVELLTVVAIIGILSAITMVAIGNARQSARTTKCAANLRQIGSATMLYTGEHKGMLPKLYASLWVGDLWPYSNTQRTYTAFGGSDLPAILTDTIFECPDAYLDTAAVKRSYAANIHISPQAAGSEVNLRTVNSPPATVMFADAMGTSSLSVTALNPRHKDKFNAVFFDGHVQLLAKAGSDILDTNYRSTFWQSQ